MTKNLNDLAADLMKVYDELRDGTIELDKAKTLAKVAASVIQTSKVMLDYQMWKTPKGDIDKSTISVIEEKFDVVELKEFTEKQKQIKEKAKKF